MCKHQQLGLDGEWHDMDEVTGKSEPIDFEDNFDVCPVCGKSPCECEDTSSEVLQCTTGCATCKHGGEAKCPYDKAQESLNKKTKKKKSSKKKDEQPEDICPFGGDISNDCADCVDSVDYHWNPKTGYCERR